MFADPWFRRYDILVTYLFEAVVYRIEDGAGFSETLQDTYKSTGYRNPEDYNLNVHLCENPTTRISTSMPLLPRRSIAV
jgi:hypothetical protein